MHLHDGRAVTQSPGLCDRHKDRREGLENESTFHDPGNALVKALTLSLDARTAVQNKR